MRVGVGGQRTEAARAVGMFGVATISSSPSTQRRLRIAADGGVSMGWSYSSPADRFRGDDVGVRSGDDMLMLASPPADFPSGRAGDGVLDCLMATKNIAASISADGLRVGSGTMAWKPAIGESCPAARADWNDPHIMVKGGVEGGACAKRQRRGVRA